MMKKVLMAVAVVVAAVQSANASIITFSQADLLAMVVVSGTAPTMNAGPSYTDAVGMSGVAGSTAALGSGGLVAYAYTGSVTLAAGDIVTVIGFNDNDDVWNLGLWAEYTAGSGTIMDVSALNGLNGGGSPPFSDTYSFVATGGELRFGVFVQYNAANTGSDFFHASWQGVPEPGSLAVWGLVCGIGLVAGRRRRS